jgi:hypothetical protein
LSEEEEKSISYWKDYPTWRWTIGSKASRAHATNVVSEIKKGIALLAKRIPALRWKSGSKATTYMTYAEPEQLKLKAMN